MCYGNGIDMPADCGYCSYYVLVFGMPEMDEKEDYLLEIFKSLDSRERAQLLAAVESLISAQKVLQLSELSNRDQFPTEAS